MMQATPSRIVNTPVQPSLFEQGVLCQRSGRLTDAERCFRGVLAQDRKHFGALVELGGICLLMGRAEEAISLLGKALKSRPESAAAHSRLGEALSASGRREEALRSFKRAAAREPQNPYFAFNLGLGQSALGHHREALECYERAIGLSPGFAEAHNARGSALRELQRLEEALESYERAITLAPHLAHAHSNRATVLDLQSRYAEALAGHERAIALRPDYADALFGRGISLLRLGRLEQGWRDYEARLSMSVARPLLGPEGRWRGEAMTGRLLVHCEQGLGDTIQFVRYVELVKQRGIEVTLVVQRALERLISHSLPVDVLALDEPRPPFERHCPLLSLPLIFGTTLETIPNAVPYLKAEPSKVSYWREKLGEKCKPRVGLVWSGGFRPDQPEVWNVNARRNIPLETISRLNSADFDFYSLQKGDPAESELRSAKDKYWSGENFFNHVAELEDFSDTAALIENLDLVISVDTSTAHLAGALGKPVWILNRFDTCWRWLLERSDTPWYPSARLYRQATAGDWSSVIEDVRRDLSANRSRIASTIGPSSTNGRA
jgi:tetratricopeptide (TPR) repeat protein